MTLRIAHLTDIHMDEPFPKQRGVDAQANWEKVLADVKSRQIEKVIFGGDIGARSSLNYFFNSLKDFDLSISPGNHDLDLEGVPHLENPEGKDGYYHFYDIDHTRIICMDSSTGQVSDAQKEWLKESLNTSLQIVLAVHHPLLAVPSYIDNRHALKDRESIQQILYETGKEVTVICGHYHLEDERSTGNIHQMVTPAASYLIEKSEQLKFRDGIFGYRILEISPQKVESNVIYLK